MNYEEIINVVFTSEGLDPSDLSNKSKLVEARAICYSLGRNIAKLELSKLGEPFNRDHSTVIHGMKTLKNLIETEKSTAHKYQNYYSLCLQIPERSFGILLQN